MPRVKSDPRFGVYRALRVQFGGSLKVSGKSFDDIGRKLGVSGRTARRYLQAPENLPYKTLVALAPYLGITIDEFRDCVRFR